MRSNSVIAVAALAFVLAGTAVAQATPARAVTPENSTRREGVDDATILSSQGFLSAHPDMMWRLEGLQARERGKYEEMQTFWRRAARYGDKPSQGLLGEAFWEGHGVAVDRALAYAWMDLAAERGYPFLLAKREHYWNALTPEERERALVAGKELYAEYGDEVAKPRLEAVLRRERRNVTGSRTGATGNLQIIVPTPGGSRSIDSAHYYADKFWEPALYWRWQDNDWRDPGLGTVEIGEIRVDENEPTLDDE